jgi:RND family efflux transporter MFP subunit
MKYTPFILFISLFFIACGGGETEFAIPDTIEEKRALLKTIKAEKQGLAEQVSTLDGQIDELKSAIEEQDPAVIKTTLVTTIPVEKSDLERFTQVQGTVQTDDIASAVSEVGGRITRLTVKEGSFVKKGQLIAAIDLEGLDKQVAELQTALGLANEVYERQKRLWDQNIGSEIQFLQAKNNKERLEKSMETINFQKTKANVYAPISGSVEMVMTKQGEVAGPGVPIVQILNTSKVNVVAEVPETLLKAVKRGQKIKIEFPALEKEVTIPITQVGRTINPANRTFKVEAALNNAKGELKPNLLAIIHINDFSAKDVVIIDQNIIQSGVGGEKYVMTVGEGNVAKKTFLKTGESAEGQVIVTEGLTAGMLLIDKGGRSVAEGDVLEIEK